MDLRTPRAIPRQALPVEAPTYALAQNLAQRLGDRVAWAPIAAVLKAHPALQGGPEVTLDQRVWIDTQSAVVSADDLHQIASAFVAGAMALASEGGQADPQLVDRVIDTAMGADSVHVAMRRSLLGTLDQQHRLGEIARPDLPHWKPSPQFECLGRLRSAVARLGGFLAAAGSQPKIPAVDVECISSVSPPSGTCGTMVVLNGRFPDPRPVGLYVAFPTSDGGTAEAELATPSDWSATQVRVRAPLRVGDGPVGLVQRPDSMQQSDPLAAVEFADTLASCVGLATRLITHRVVALPPVGGLTIPLVIPRLSEDRNVFHGGPVFVSVKPSTATLGQELVVTGVNLEAGDSVVLDGQPLKTRFVDAKTLAAFVGGTHLRGGARSLWIRRGTGCNSNTGGVNLRASMTPPDRPRCRVGQFFELTGFGFEEGGMRATVGGEDAPIYVRRTDLMQVQARRPHLSALQPNRAGEEVPIEVFHRDVSIGRFTLALETYRIVVFGDSILWGQGLLERDKFPALVARQVAAGLDTVYAVDRSARSGAEVSAEGGTPPGAPNSVFDAPTSGAQNAAGEVPSSTPSIAAQVAEWLASPLDDARPFVDLVLLDGSINDIGVTTILDPTQDDDALAAQVSAVVGNPSTLGDTMTLIGVLESLRVGFASPRTRFVVTGYYPIVSERSDLTLLLALLISLGVFATSPVAAALTGNPFQAAAASTGLALWARTRLIDRSGRFARVANDAMRQAVDTIRQRPAGERFTFAAPAFATDNAIFGPDPWVYGCSFIDEGGFLQPEDPIADARKVLCSTLSGVSRLKCEIASIGHPNPRGARAYADAVIAAMA
jgi:hypothetical protein